MRKGKYNEERSLDKTGVVERELQEVKDVMVNNLSKIVK